MKKRTLSSVNFHVPYEQPKMDFVLPSVDQKLVPFIIIYAPDSIEGQQTLAQIDLNIQIVNSLVQEYINESTKSLPKLYKTNPPDQSTLLPIAKYCLTKLKHYQSKLYHYNENYYMKCATMVSQGVHFLMDAKNFNYCAHIDAEKLHESIIKEHDENPTYTKLMSRIKRMDKLAEKYCNAPKFPFLPPEQLMAILRESSKFIEQSSEYCPPNTVDDFLYYFIMTHGGFAEMDELASIIISKINKNTIDFQPFNIFIKNYIKNFGPMTSNEAIVLRSSVVRIFFDRFYIQYADIYSREPDTEDFLASCNLMRWSSPSALGFNPKMLNRELFDTPFAAFAMKSPLIHKSLSNLSFVQFYTNPCDILASVFRSLKCCEEYVRKVGLDEKYGELLSMFDQTKLMTEANDMSFDDFFPLFCAVFSLDPPANAIAVKNFLESISRLSISSTFDFAKVFYISCVNHMKQLDPSKLLSQTPIEDDYDPLL